MNLKQLFCRHIWKVLKTEPLYRITEHVGFLLYETYEYEAWHCQCLKCEKKSIMLQKHLIM